MISFDVWSSLAIMLVLAGISGIPLAFALLKKTGFGIIEKKLIGITLGMILPPFVSFIGNAFLGIEFNMSYALAANAVVAVIGLALFAYTKAWEGHSKADFMPKLPEKYDLETVSELAGKLAPLAILALVIISFLIRYQSFSPVYSEIDPYWYLYGGGQLISLGHVPLHDNVVWYPILESGHRSVPLLHHLWASWYSIISGNAAYNNYLFALVSGIYAPIFGALTVFFAYLLVSREYGKSIGLLAAGLLAALPIHILHSAGGQAQVVTANFFGLFFFFATFALALKWKDLRVLALSCIAAGYVILATNVSSVFGIGLALFVGAYAALLYFEKEKANMEFLIKSTAAVAIASTVLVIILNIYYAAKPYLTPELLIFASAAFAAALYYLKWHVKTNEKRMYYAAAGLVAAFAVLAFTPVGAAIVGGIKDQLSGILVYDAVFRTIAEQGAAPASYQNEFGFVGMNTSGILEYLTVPFDIIAKLFLGIFGLAVNVFFGLPSSIPSKDSTLTLAIFGSMVVAAALGLARAALHLLDKKHFEWGFLFIMLFFLIFPTSFGGLYRLKFESYLGVFSTLAIAFFLGELILFVKGVFKHYSLKADIAYLPAFAFIAMAVLVAAQFFTVAPWGAALLSSSLTPRYQDNPSMFTAQFQSICAKTNDATVCGAVLNKSFDDSINNQYNTNLCYISVVKDYNSPTDWEKSIIAPFKCGKIADYWVNSMEWIKDNVNSSDRVISWWDYGHWINYFGEKNAVIGNTQASYYMIQRTAFAYTKGTPQDLKDTMNAFGSKTALFDVELVGSYTGFGGKYGALNYLACNYLNQTDASKSTGASKCEADYMWEEIYVPVSQSQWQSCTVSESQKITGVVAMASQRTEDASGQAQYSLVPRYCLTQGITLATGEQLPIVSYYLDRRDAEGNLALNHAIIRQAGASSGYIVFHPYYLKAAIWPGENGTAVSGWEDRIGKGKFYDTNLYNAFFNEDLPGFKLVYKTPDDNVKIFQME
ncbi:MAG: hypothetical protein WC506_01050 [Candidatus Micrarchaeia archaeon]